MGILPRHLHLLAIEQAKHPVKGDVITFGQQMVHASLGTVRKIFSQHNVQMNELPEGFNTKSKISDGNNSQTNAEAIFKMLGARNVYAADISGYENADFIIDFNEPIPSEFENRFDVVLDIGTIEHVFDVSTALSNIVRMLKPGGLVILGCPVSNTIDHGFYSFSPTLLFDYFNAQGFGDFTCYLSEGSVHNLYLRSKTYLYSEVKGQFPIISRHSIEIMFWARMNNKPDKIIKPNQSLFIKMWKDSQAATMNAKKVVSPTRLRLNKLIRGAINLIPARIRPEFVDSTIFSMGSRFNKRDNLHFIGKF